MNLLPMIIEVVGGLIFEIQVWQYTVCTFLHLEIQCEATRTNFTSLLAL